MEQSLNLSQNSWNLTTKLSFRFFFAYFALYIFPFPLSAIQVPFDFSLIWDAPVLWFGKMFFGYDITIRPNGSGDTTWNYIQVLMIAIISFLATVVWSIVDHKRSNYNKLWLWLTVFLRFYLGSVMIGYGFAKVIKTQFPSPFLGRLGQSYGESSPMGLLWTFMGYSRGYNFFTGMAEITGGFLLFFRRTVLLGALVCIGVMINVVMLNFTYDVPVKLFSSHLLAIAVFLMIPDVKRLADFFIFNKPVDAASSPTLLTNKVGKYVFIAVQVLFIGYVMLMLPLMGLEMTKQYGDYAPKPAFYGRYDVKVHALNGDTLPPIMDHKTRWKSMTVEFKDWATVDYMDEVKVYWRFSADTMSRTVNIYSMDSVSHYKFNYTDDGFGNYALIGGDSTSNIYFKLKRKLPQDYLLMNRGFNWVNEQPFNR
jgi:hypothetical protein